MAEYHLLLWVMQRLHHSSKVIGAVDEFNAAIRVVIRDVSFDNDVIVSVFETNIRVLG